MCLLVFCFSVFCVGIKLFHYTANDMFQYFAMDVKDAGLLLAALWLLLQNHSECLVRNPLQLLTLYCIFTFFFIRLSLMSLLYTKPTRVFQNVNPGIYEFLIHLLWRSVNHDIALVFGNFCADGVFV